MAERPPADPQKLIDHYRTWQEGEELPGRTMANLKTGGLGELVAASGDEALTGPWNEWEAGKAGPADVLGRLGEGGLVGYLSALVPA